MIENRKREKDGKNPEKIKDIVKSCIFDIRKELGYTQKEFGKILSVSDRAIQNYEAQAPDYSFPIEKAMLIHNKWNYSLDQIYLGFPSQNSFNRFNVDIRDFISIEGDSVVFSIPDYYWEYINEAHKINESDSTPQEKNRLVKNLEAKYTGKSNCIIWKREMPICDFLSFVKFGENEISYVGKDEEITFVDPSEDQIKQVTDFLNDIAKGDHD